MRHGSYVVHVVVGPVIGMYCYVRCVKGESLCWKAVRPAWDEV